ncbi:basic proline-rich protein-like [Choloepus didactylus]|uniref:basic proline-rich protein-like n=1 Tax=Choloepus didactylus TaxID=27675 RepID=UPI0018A08ED5|nr:basic proline-rich protein-like [Choloepus didactylus]
MNSLLQETDLEKEEQGIKSGPSPALRNGRTDRERVTMETPEAKHNAPPPPVYLEKGSGRAGASQQPPAGPTPRPAPVLQGTQPSGLAVQYGAPPGGARPEAWKPGTQDSRDRGWGTRRNCPSPTLGPASKARTPGPSTGGPSETRAWPEQPTLRPAGLSRHGGARPAAPSGSRTAAWGCHRPCWFSRTSTAVHDPGQACLTCRERRAHIARPRRPLRAAGAKPVTAAPAAAQPAPPPPEALPAPPPRRQRFRAGAEEVSGSGRGSVDRSLPPHALFGAPCWLEEGPQRSAPGDSRNRLAGKAVPLTRCHWGPPPTPALPAPFDTLKPAALPAPDPHPSHAGRAAEGSKVQWL